jgi:hypothetical protein
MHRITTAIEPGIAAEIFSGQTVPPGFRLLQGIGGIDRTTPVR